MNEFKDIQVNEIKDGVVAASEGMMSAAGWKSLGTG